ncbi:MAG: hypothetical protein WBO08_06710 [Mycobacterium sp.]|nr:hypothetical protein [Mycobacterium sp.]
MLGTTQASWAEYQLAEFADSDDDAYPERTEDPEHATVLWSKGWPST